MPYTWGASISDSANVVFTVGGQNSAFLATGWFYPTALTAGRYLISVGASSATANYGIRVGTTTNTLQMTSCTATPGLWTATADAILFPAGITTNTWWFIAYACSINTAVPSTAYKAWIGTVDTPPTAMTIVNNTAPAGITGSGLWQIGNTSGSSLAFQGEIATTTLLLNAISSSSNLQITTAGSISTDEEAFIARTFVTPIWSGNIPAVQNRDGTTSLYGSAIIDFRGVPSYTLQGLASSTRSSVSISGITEAQTDQPRWYNPTAVGMTYPPVRR